MLWLICGLFSYGVGRAASLQVVDDFDGRRLRRHFPSFLLRLLGRPMVVEHDGGLVLPRVDEKLQKWTEEAF